MKDFQKKLLETPGAFVMRKYRGQYRPVDKQILRWRKQRAKSKPKAPVLTAAEAFRQSKLF